MDSFFQIFRDAHNIPGIRKVGVIGQQDIPEMFAERFLAGERHFSISGPRWIDEASDARMSVSMQITDNSFSMETVLSFSVLGDPPGGPLALVICDSGGQQWLLSALGPHCGTIKVNRSTSSPAGDPAATVCTYTVPFLPVPVEII